MGTLYSHPSYTKYDLFCQAADIKITDDKDPIAVLAHLISDDEDKEENGIKPQIGPLRLSIPKRNHLSKATPLPPPPEDNEFESQSANCRNFTSAQSQRVLQHQNYLQSSKMATPQWLSMKKTAKKVLQKQNY